MSTLREDIKEYADRVDKNYQTLINVLSFASQQLTTLLNEKDPPKKDNPAFIESLLNLSLAVVFPQVAAFIKAKKLSEAAKGFVDDMEMAYGHVKAIPEAITATKTLLDSAKKEAESTSATLGMMDSIIQTYKRLEREKAAAAVFFSALKQLPEGSGGKPATAQKGKARLVPPELLGLHVDDLMYAFVYSLVRETVQKYGEVQIVVNKTWGDYSTANIVLERKLKPFSETATNWIFTKLTRGLSGRELPATENVPGAPATNRIEPVTNWVQLATAWRPKVKLEAAAIGMTGDGDRYRNFKKGERLNSIFVELHKVSNGYVPRLNKFGVVEGFDDPITAIIKRTADLAKR